MSPKSDAETFYRTFDPDLDEDAYQALGAAGLWPSDDADVIFADGSTLTWSQVERLNKWALDYYFDPETPRPKF